MGRGDWQSYALLRTDRQLYGLFFKEISLKNSQNREAYALTHGTFMLNGTEPLNREISVPAGMATEERGMPRASANAYTDQDNNFLGAPMDPKVADLIHKDTMITREEILAMWPIGSGTDFEILRAYGQMVKDTEFDKRWESGLTPDPDRNEIMAELIAEHQPMMLVYAQCLVENGIPEKLARDMLKEVFTRLNEDASPTGESA